MITGKDLMEWGLLPGPVYKTALRVLVPNPKGFSKAQIETVIRSIIKDPETFKDVEWARSIAGVLIAEKAQTSTKTTLAMNAKCCPLTIYGDAMIEQEARNQIYTASKLPISVKAALMPDAHAGYGLPIGGVLAVKNAVIPWAVGVDIGCRMQMSVFDIPGKGVQGMKDMLSKILQENTVFGAGQDIGIKVSSPVLDDERFDLPLIKKLHLREQAVRQIGTSGGGNHFVEFGIVDYDFEPKLAVLSHSGSRGIGYKIATIYSDIAMDKCKLPGDAKHLAWLELSSSEGAEYWAAMNLAGDYAKACHDVIHERIRKELKASMVKRFENHHNFAWKEKVGGEDVIVHRKGATPAGIGQTGIIPGSMTTSTYIVEGRGNIDSICSSSHGAGRLMSRKAAKESFTMSQMTKDLEDRGVTLIGGSIDESSMAYKDIEGVMEAQKDLVVTLGKFQPMVVRMAGEERKPWETE